MRDDSSSFSGGGLGVLRVDYTDKPVSGWGGLVLVARHLEAHGIRALLREALPDSRTSPNQIDVTDMIFAFFATILTGGRRFAHVERVRQDEVVKSAFGVTRMPSAMTLTRYFGGFLRSHVEQLSEVLTTFTKRFLKSPVLGSVLDLDSTVFLRYGQQEGSLKGYNPQKRGRPSHHPILAMLAEKKQIVHAWLRSGNCGTATGLIGFFSETLTRLPEGFRLYAVRADSGFYIDSFMCYMEQLGVAYTIPVRLYLPLKRAMARLEDWEPCGRGFEASEMLFQAGGWKAARRIVVVRERVEERPEAPGRKLIDVPGYRYHAIVTTLEHRPVEIWRFYNSRADCENRLKELKNDYGAAGFCLSSFEGTDAAFRLVCFLFNLMAEFKREVTQDESPQLGTLRPDLFVVGASLGAEGREPVLRLGLPSGTLREKFQGLLDRVTKLLKSTVAQFGKETEKPHQQRTARWKQRPPWSIGRRPNHRPVYGLRPRPRIAHATDTPDRPQSPVLGTGVS